MPPRVDLDAKVGDLAADLLQHVLDRIDIERRELVDVLPLIAALGNLFPPSPRLDRRPEEVDLPARVVEVVLALDVVTREVEQARNGVSVGTVTRGADGQRPGRIGRDQLDLDLLRLLRLAGAVVRADLAQRIGKPPGRHPQVEESGPGDLGALDLLELLGACRQFSRQLAWRSFPLRRGPQRDVRGVVAVRGIARPLELDGRTGDVGEPRG